MKTSALFNVKALLAVLTLVMLTGCSTIKVEMNGLPAPDYIKQVKVLGLEVKLDMAYAYFYQRPEGDEMLDTLQYIESSGIDFNIRKDNLTSIRCMVNVFNPNKSYYVLKIHHSVYDAHGKHLASSAKTLYAGDLSSKNFVEELSVIGTVTHEVWISLYDKEGVVRYSEPLPLRYKVL